MKTHSGDPKKEQFRPQGCLEGKVGLSHSQAVCVPEAATDQCQMPEIQQDYNPEHRA